MRPRLWPPGGVGMSTPSAVDAAPESRLPPSWSLNFHSRFALRRTRSVIDSYYNRSHFPVLPAVQRVPCLLLQRCRALLLRDRDGATEHGVNIAIHAVAELREQLALQAAKFRAY